MTFAIGFWRPLEVGGSNVGGADYVTGWQGRDERERTGDSEELREDCVERSDDDESEEGERVEKEVLWTLSYGKSGSDKHVTRF